MNNREKLERIVQWAMALQRMQTDEVYICPERLQWFEDRLQTAKDDLLATLPRPRF